jgi:hypothetical protein
MATILPISQKWVDVDRTRNVVLGIHRVKLVSTSDTFRVPALAEAHASVSCKQLERSGDATVTVTASDADSDGNYNTVTVAGTVGDDVMIVTVHQGKLNFSEDEDA